MEEEKLEIRGILRKDIISYLLQLGSKAVTDELFVSESWECEVSTEERFFMFQSWIPKVQILFRSEDETVLKTVLVNFRKKTFRAGG
ncbi:hypothetical protein DS745_00030 [Anaerobacillus alkaliphilus]|uniref:Molybdopterin cofactor biosynthesis MoaD-related C-terminal domain-containing protein n=1 Tax=Anaerobacillus alkaliphilus TaxID=1548597 RepID=A0A4Q0VXD3_9BACI|nr:hypothetical protein [Anaerobacillus alkaliphilus]RXJ03816.1 hypothetical protein DS745_00030 [Anaerobacillus alkaliphilus]